MRLGVGAHRPRAAAGVKIGFDVVLASLILLLLAPLMALIALCIVLESPGPIVYGAKRVGRNRRELDVLKFRKMHHGATGRPLTLADDDRFTRIGGWLARTKLDELPQLINVIRGEMSLIGPRPEDPRFVERHADAFRPIVQVRPGITGLSQLAFAAESRILDPEDPIGHYENLILPQKLELDHLYISRWRLSLDLRILFWTLATTVLGLPVSVSRKTARMTVRRTRVSEKRGALLVSERRSPVAQIQA